MCREVTLSSALSSDVHPGHPASYLALEPETITPCFPKRWPLEPQHDSCLDLVLPQCSSPGRHRIKAPALPVTQQPSPVCSWQECQLVLPKRDDLLPLLFLMYPTLAPTAFSEETPPTRKKSLPGDTGPPLLVLNWWAMYMRHGFWRSCLAGRGTVVILLEAPRTSPEAVTGEQ